MLQTKKFQPNISSRSGEEVDFIDFAILWWQSGHMSIKDAVVSENKSFEWTYTWGRRKILLGSTLSFLTVTVNYFRFRLVFILLFLNTKVPSHSEEKVDLLAALFLVPAAMAAGTKNSAANKRTFSAWSRIQDASWILDQAEFLSF